MKALTLEQINVFYRGVPALWNISAEIPSGSLVGLVGPNGSGKSTLIKTCAGLLPLESGSIRFFGNKNIEEVRDQVTYLPQRESVDWDFPINVMDVVLMGSYRRVGILRKPGPAEVAFAKECLDKVSLRGFEFRQIGELSGGQQQRVFLARALMTRAEVFLLDEPFAAVDALTEETIMKVIKELRTQGKTIVIAHHDLQSVSENTDHVLLLNTRLVTFGPTAETMTFENLRKAYGGQVRGLANVLFSMSERNR
jgi:manganese/zinc/iron transport system ATP- binding protein